MVNLKINPKIDKESQKKVMEGITAENTYRKKEALNKKSLVFIEILQIIYENQIFTTRLTETYDEIFIDEPFRKYFTIIIVKIF